MPLPAALVLSGLESDHFDSELKPIYDHGVRLLEPLNEENPDVDIIEILKSDNGCTMMAKNNRTCSVESGFATGPSEFGSASSESTETYWEFLSQLDQVKLEQHSPQTLTDSTVAITWPSQETPSPRTSSTPTPEPVIKYGGRDLLDLGSHLRSGGSWKYRATVLPDVTIAPRSFLIENRSQYSRLYNDFLPPKQIETCPAKDCQFETPVYEKNVIP